MRKLLHGMWIAPSIVAIILFLQYAEGTFRHLFLDKYLTGFGYTHIRQVGYRYGMEGEHGILTGFEAMDKGGGVVMGTVVINEHGRRIKYE